MHKKGGKNNYSPDKLVTQMSVLVVIFILQKTYDIVESGSTINDYTLYP